jgi:hypothetical protein
VFFPVYNDEATVARVTEKVLRVCDEIAATYEVIIVDDGSPDASGRIADALAGEHPAVRVIRHPRNLGYGAAVRSGLHACRNEWICFTDGDDEYDVRDLRKLWRLRHHYDLIITFRYVRRYSGFGILISRVYNVVLRHLFFTRFRDVSTGLRLVRRSLVDELTLEATSPFIGAEIAIKSMLKGYRVGELGIQTFPREFGRAARRRPRTSTAPSSTWSVATSACLHRVRTPRRRTSARPRARTVPPMTRATLASGCRGFATPPARMAKPRMQRSAVRACTRLSASLVSGSELGCHLSSSFPIPGANTGAEDA